MSRPRLTDPDHPTNEKVAAGYLKNAIDDGFAAQILADLNRLDQVVSLLGIQDDFITPADEIKRRFGDHL